MFAINKLMHIILVKSSNAWNMDLYLKRGLAMLYIYSYFIHKSQEIVLEFKNLACIEGKRETCYFQMHDEDV